MTDDSALPPGVEELFQPTRIALQTHELYRRRNYDTSGGSQEQDHPAALPNAEKT